MYRSASSLWYKVSAENYGRGAVGGGRGREGYRVSERVGGPINCYVLEHDAFACTCETFFSLFMKIWGSQNGSTPVQFKVFKYSSPNSHICVLCRFVSIGYKKHNHQSRNNGCLNEM